jgi:hypothetical protein
MAAFTAVILTLVVLGFFAAAFIPIGNCGLGPDAQQSCYDAQEPWMRAAVAMFAAAGVAAAILIFGRKKGR